MGLSDFFLDLACWAAFGRQPSRATANDGECWGLGWCHFDTSQIEYGKAGVLAHDFRGMSVWADLGEIVSLTGVESETCPRVSHLPWWDTCVWGQVSHTGAVRHPGSQFTAKYSTDNATWFWF